MHPNTADDNGFQSKFSQNTILTKEIFLTTVHWALTARRWGRYLDNIKYFKHMACSTDCFSMLWIHIHSMVYLKWGQVEINPRLCFSHLSINSIKELVSSSSCKNFCLTFHHSMDPLRSINCVITSNNSNSHTSVSKMRCKFFSSMTAPLKILEDRRTHHLLQPGHKLSPVWSVALL